MRAADPTTPLHTRQGKERKENDEHGTMKDELKNGAEIRIGIAIAIAPCSRIRQIPPKTPKIIKKHDFRPFLTDFHDFEPPNPLIFQFLEIFIISGGTTPSSGPAR